MAAEVDNQADAEFSILEIDLDHFVKRKMGYIPFSRWEMIKLYKYFLFTNLIFLGALIYYAFVNEENIFILLI